MADEIERKFLVGTQPVPEVLTSGARLRQGYLAVDGDVEVRIRFDEDVATLTVKAGRGLRRTEVDLPVDGSEADALWALTDARRIVKVRHAIPLESGVCAELDIYDGPLAGLMVVEVEFADMERADAFVPPDWFGDEVTGDARWSNAALARDGAPSRA